MLPSTRAADAAKRKLTKAQKITAAVQNLLIWIAAVICILYVNGAGFDHPAERVRKLAHLYAG